MIFPHAGNYEIEDREFIRAWAKWLVKTDTLGKVDADRVLPRLAQAVKYEALMEGGRGHGVDALCRSLVPDKYRNTMQATNQFMAANDRILQSTRCQNPTSGITVEGVALSDQGRKMLRALGAELPDEEADRRRPALATTDARASHEQAALKEKNGPVDRLIQLEMDPDTGHATVKAIRPVTNAVLTWWKSHGNEDTVDISEDSSRSTLRIDGTAEGDGLPSGGIALIIYIEAYEEEDRAQIIVYHDALASVAYEHRGRLLEMVNNLNLATVYGAWRLISTDDSRVTVCYSNSVCLRGIDQGMSALIETMFEVAYEAAPGAFTALLGALDAEAD